MLRLQPHSKGFENSLNQRLGFLLLLLGADVLYCPQYSALCNSSEQMEDRLCVSVLHSCFCNCGVQASLNVLLDYSI
jgi:hypothetical protein